MRLLITGGAGCLGSNLVERYLPQGYEILVIDNFATSRREVFPELPGLMVVEGSIADRDLVKRNSIASDRLMSSTAQPPTRIRRTGTRTPRPMSLARSM